MTRGMKAYLAVAGLVLGLHLAGGIGGWWKEAARSMAAGIRSLDAGSGSGSGGFRGGK